MKRSLWPLALALVWFGCATPQPALPPTPMAGQTAPTTPQRPMPYPVDLPGDFLQAVERGTRTLDGRPGAAYWTNTAAYSITTRLLPEEKRLEGQARIRYTNGSPNALEVLRLELAQNAHAPGALRNEPAESTGGVELARVAIAGRSLSTESSQGPRYSVQGTQLVIVPAVPVAPGSSVEIEVDWGFIVPQAGAGARMGYSGEDLFYLAYWYPHMAVYDDLEGWVTDPFTLNAEFYHGFADYDVTVEVPSGWIVAATGALQNPGDVFTPELVQRMERAHRSEAPLRVLGPEHFDAATKAGPLRYRFRAERVRDFAFSATRRSIWDAARTSVGDRDGDGQEDFTAINTFWRESAPLWSEVTAYQQHSINFLSRYTGFPYPWPHMTAVEGGGIIGGGMEFPMMTLMGDYNTRGAEALYNVTAHELAHMWIPLVVSTNERRYSWIDEGATSFAENQARKEYFPGPDHDLGDQETYLRVAKAGMEGEMMRRSDFHYSPAAFTIASYSKPASVLVALREVLGEDVFNEAYRTFIREWAYKHPTPYDLWHTFERVSNRDLDWFWRAWYYETWTLDHALARVETDGGRVTVHIEDRGRVPMPVRLVFTTEDGQTHRREIPVETWLRGATEATHSETLTSPVVRVEIDPEQRFPDVDRSNNVWTR